jgi:hypothetical protein
MPRYISRVAVFCGSNAGRGEVYRDAAARLGATLASRHIGIVYGGTHKGLMGILADSALAQGGEVTGIITRRLADKGHLHPGLTGHEIVEAMRARKTRMAQIVDAFIALPGGIGTVEEFMEMWTLNQLGDLDAPVGLLDVNGFFKPFMGFVDHMIAEGFLPEPHREGIVVEADPVRLIERLAAFEKPRVEKWMA